MPWGFFNVAVVFLFLLEAAVIIAANDSVICCKVMPGHGKPGLARNFRAWARLGFSMGRAWASDLGPMDVTGRAWALHIGVFRKKPGPRPEARRDFALTGRAWAWDFSRGLFRRVD